MDDFYRVYYLGNYPKPSRVFHKGRFSKRGTARQWCYNHKYLPGLVIVHPDGTEEPYKWRDGLT